MKNRGHAGFQKSQAAKKAIMFGKSATAKAPAPQAAPAPVDPASVMPGQPGPSSGLAPMPSKGGNFGGAGGM